MDIKVKTLWEKYYSALKQQEWTKAYAALNAIKEIRHDDSQVYLKTGDLLQRMGDTTGAIKAYHKAAVYLVKEGFMQKAAAIFKIILRLDPANSEASAKLKRVIEVASTAKGAFSQWAPSKAEEFPPVLAMAPASVEPFDPSKGLLNTEDDAGPPQPKRDEEPPAYNEVPLTDEVTGTEKPGIPSYGEITLPDSETGPSGPGERELGPGYGEITLDEEEASEGATGVWPTEKPEQKEFEDFDDLLAEASRDLPTLEEGPILYTGLPAFLMPIGEEQAAEIAGRAAKKIYKTGDRIIKEGDTGDSLFFIKQGTVKVVAHILGKEFVLTALGEGDVFGEVTFLTGRPRTASVVAGGDVEILEFNRPLLEEAISINPEVLEFLNDLYDERVSTTLKKIGSD